MTDPTQTTITPFLMFTGQAEEALRLYTSLFEAAEIVSLERYGPEEAGPEGSVRHAVFTLNGQKFMCIDSYVKHDFSFTASSSLFVTCTFEAEVDRLFEELSRGGSVAMPLAPYPFSPKFAWVTDRFGVSWQLSLALQG